MLAYLQSEPDDLLCIIACGIEDCILPGYEYRSKVEKKLYELWKMIHFLLVRIPIISKRTRSGGIFIF